MGDERFYGFTLTPRCNEVTWDSQGEEEYPGGNKLVIRQALLGVNAKPGEVNVVEVQTRLQEGSIKIPMAVLKVGEMRHVSLDIEFPDSPVIFTLIKGSGPVHILGAHLPGKEEDLEESDEDGDGNGGGNGDENGDEGGPDSVFEEEERKRKALESKRRVNETPGSDADDEDGEPMPKKSTNSGAGKASSSEKKAKE